MLTGTPLQNDLGELHNLLSFLLPSLFKDAADTEEANFGEWLPRLEAVQTHKCATSWALQHFP